MQLAFAVFSEGNAEFMVMLPFLFILVINGFFQIKGRVYLYTAIAMFIWNIGFGLFPNYSLNLQNQFKTIELIHSSKNAVFILSDDVLVQNMIYYKTGISWNSNIYKSPASIKLLGKNTHTLSKSIDSCLNNQTVVYTDCIDEPFVLNRKTWLQKNENELFFKDYKVQKVDSNLSFTGTKYLFLIDAKKESISKLKTLQFGYKKQ
jgi:hypothetical protein